MSEPLATDIYLGGDLPKALLPKLLKAIKDDLYDLYMGTTDEKDFLREPCSKWGGQCNYGTPDEVLAFCKRHGISIVIPCEACGEFGGFTVWWVPGMKKEMTVSSDNETTTTISIETARSLCDILLAVSKEGINAVPRFIGTPHEDIAKKILRNPKRMHVILRQAVDKAMPVVPKIPELKLVE